MGKRVGSIVRTAFLLSMVLAFVGLNSGCATYGSPDGVRVYEFNGYRGNEFRKLPPHMTRTQSMERGAVSEPLAQNLHTNTRMNWNPTLEDQLAQMDGIQKAHVILTESQAYVAVELDHAGQTPAPAEASSMNLPSDDAGMTDSMHQAIVKAVKQSADPVIQHVFVSANEEFVSEVKQIRASQDQGVEMSRQVQWLNRIANVHFPDLQGTGADPGSFGSGQVSQPRGAGQGMYSPSTGVRQR